MPRIPARPAAAAAPVPALAACFPAAPQPAPPTGAAPRWGHTRGTCASPNASKVLVATHDGLYDCSSPQPALTGAAPDCTGFTGDGAALYASARPERGEAQPHPPGVARSTDGGATWGDLSLQGGAVGFDGRLRTTPDMSAWADAGTQVQPFALAGRPDTPVVLATAQDGLKRSADAVQTWAPVAGAPLVQFAALASPATAVGISADGTVYTTADAGLARAAAGRATGQVEARTATESNGTVRVWAATGTGVLLSRDGGKAFAPCRGKG